MRPLVEVLDEAALHAMPMTSITGMASRIESGTDQSISTAPKSPNQVWASGVRISSGVPQAVRLRLDR
jgi:hypothetical protein